MAVAIDASSPAIVTSSTTSAVTASFTPVANSTIIALVSVGNSTGAGTISGTVTDSLTSGWTKMRSYTTATNGCVELWAMDAGSSPASRTVTLTGTGGTNAKGLILDVMVLTGAEPAAKIMGEETQGNVLTAYMTIRRTGSLVVMAVADNTSASGAYTAVDANTTLRQSFVDGTNGEKNGTARSTNTLTRGESISFGFSATSSAPRFGAWEIMAPVATGTPIDGNITLRNPVGSGRDAYLRTDYNVSNARAYVNDSALLESITDIHFVFRCSLDAWAAVSGNSQSLLTRWEGSNWMFDLEVRPTTPIWRLLWSTNGTTSLFYDSSNPSLTNDTMYWFRVKLDVDNGASGKTCTMEWAADAESVPTSGWTNFLNITQAPTTSLYTGGTSMLNIGTLTSAGGLYSSKGKFKRVIIYPTVESTTPLLDINFTKQATGATSFTEDSSNAVTVNIGAGAKILGAKFPIILAAAVSYISGAYWGIKNRVT